jgi:beta-N-acetylhexosaminidase
VQSRVGNALMLGFQGTELPDWILDFEKRFGLGGVILFDRDLRSRSDLRNIESKEQVRALCDRVHALDSRPMVFIDQEGGRVTRLKVERGFRALPSAAEFATMDDARARSVVESSFTEMASLGIDFNLAPVIDLNINPSNPNIGALERSFSSDAMEVRRCVGLCSEAAKKVGLQLCLKHFPGLGGAETDSHTDLTDITDSIDSAQLALFDELCPTIPGSAILLSHGLVRNWDSDWPVSLSRTAVDLVRRSNPEALIITDDMQMQGLRTFCSVVDGGVRAHRAGADLLCVGNNLEEGADESVLLAEALAENASRSVEERERTDSAIARVERRKEFARRATVRK